MLEKDFENDKELVAEKLDDLIEHMPLQGQWPLDIMKNGDDFCLIDMALAGGSALNDRIKGRLAPTKERWLPSHPVPLPFPSKEGAGGS